MKKLLPTIIPIKLGIVYSFIVRDQKTIIIDTGYPGNTQKILASLQKNQIRPDDISLIAITHGHIDHYGSVEELRDRTGAPIAMHRADSMYVQKGINCIGKGSGVSGGLFKALFIRSDKVQSKTLNANIEFENELDLSPYGVQGSLMHTPGHTGGSCSCIVPGEAAIIGDLLMGGLLFSRKPGYPLFIDNKSRIMDSIQRIKESSPKIIYPSHGRPFGPSDIKKLL